MTFFKIAAILCAAGASPLAAAAAFSISPETIYECASGLGHATLTWSGAASAAQIRVGSPQGVAMTGFDGTSGTVTTGDWVSNGMTFFLVNQQGIVEGTLAARVNCGGTASTLEQGLKNGSFFPLQTGNTWVYRINSRQVTSDYITRTVTGTAQFGNQTYFTVMQTYRQSVTLFGYLRGDNQGRIWQFTPTAANPAETLLLDPAAERSGPFSSVLGSFPQAVFQSRTGPGSLSMDDSVFVRGLGLARTQSTMLTGSSGGFLSSLELVEVRLADGVHLSQAAPHLALFTESTVLDVNGQHVTNCAVPCYFAACGLAPGADAPGTYKPCAQVRIDGHSESAYTLELVLYDSRSQVVYRTLAAPGAAGDFLDYVQVQLYYQPNQPFMPGSYTLFAYLRSGGQDIATAFIPIRIQ